MQLIEKTAVVVGGASGVGLAAALALFREGASIYIADNDEKRGRAMAERLQERAGYIRECHFVGLDSTDPNSVESAVKTILQDCKRIDIVVNFIGWPEELNDVSKDSVVEEIVRRNLTGSMNVVKGFLPGMIANESGKVVLVSTDDGRVEKVGETVNAWLNRGVSSFARDLAGEMAPHSVNVNCVCVRSGKPVEGAKKPQGPAEIANVIAFFATPASNHITGQTLRLTADLEAAP